MELKKGLPYSTKITSFWNVTEVPAEKYLCVLKEKKKKKRMGRYSHVKETLERKQLNLSYSEVLILEMLPTLAQIYTHIHIYKHIYTYTHTSRLYHFKNKINQTAKSSKVLVYGLLNTSQRRKFVNFLM